MPAYNKIILLGNLTRDPQLKYLPSGAAICEFGLAVNHKFKGKDGNAREEVLFVDCTAFGKAGEVIAQYCQKGKPLLVEGRLKFDTWEDKQGGGKRSKHSVIVENFQFVGGDGASGGERQERAPSQRPAKQPARNADDPMEAPATEFYEADIPF